MSAPRAVVVAVGDELLLGNTVDTNGAWLGRELGLLGVGVVRRAVVGDSPSQIADAVADGLGRADLVVVTGGLGPTDDDVTRQAVADLLGRPLRTDAGLLEALRARFRARGYEDLPPANLSQAQVPEGARIMDNPWGTAPGLYLSTGTAAVALLPGVPREMKGIFAEGLVPLLREAFGARLRTVHQRVLRTTGIPESVLSERVGARLPDELGPVDVAFLPHVTGVDLRLTAREAPSAAEAEAWFDRIEAALEPALADVRYHAESGDLVEAVAAALLESGHKVAVAESCTGGLLAKRLTDRPGSSRWFTGGIVAYADEVKVRELDVPPATLAAVGAVSREVAELMARGVARRLGASVSLAVTGVAGPEGGSADKPVGTVWHAALVDGSVTTRRERFPGGRAEVRERAAQTALFMLLRGLEGRG